MGSVIAFPYEEALAVAEQRGITDFVETGTFVGVTARWAAEHFTEVHTIELSEPLYDAQATAAYAQRYGLWPANVTAWLGDSRQILPKIKRYYACIGEPPMMYWLDGHWDGTDQTAGRHDQCPLLGELACIGPKDVVLIDDARLFLTPNQPPFVGWPSFAEVVAALGDRVVTVKDDVIWGIPR